MTDKDNDQTSGEVTMETTSVFHADFLNEINEPDAPAATGTKCAISGIEGLPTGSALLVVKRGPNAGSRFLLDQPVTSAGRHPTATSSWMTSPSAAGTPSSGYKTKFHVVDVGSLNGTYVNRRPVDAAVLVNGDEVQIGKFRLVFLIGPTTG